MIVFPRLFILAPFLLVFYTCAAHSVTLKSLSKNSEIDSGFVSILHDNADGKTYLKIDNIGQEFIYLNSLPNGLGSNDIGLDRGQLGETRLAVFERAGNKLFLKQKPDYYRAITENALEAAAVDEAFAASILWGFTIEDSGADWVLVDASEFLLQDVHGVGRKLAQQKQGSGFTVDASRSAVDLSRTKAFPDNTELQATVTLVGSEPGNFVKDTAPHPYSISLKMRHSFIRLPDQGYATREHMPKSGFWEVEYLDYAQPINADIRQRLIGRHRLQKQNPDAKVSEAVEPIVYYLDPGVPEPVRSALVDGALWWNQAFEALGYRDAFQVKMLPDGADPLDVRYNVIQWVHRATRGWSYGYSVIDPRTGEIIKGHVTLGSLRVRQDYLIAQGMLAPFAENSDDQALMDLALARIRQLSAHEVGHTLGLSHNFASSNYGRESVMDYPHPYFELSESDPNTVVAPNAYDVGIGDWDKAAIAYGYQDIPSGLDERKVLAALIAQNDANGLLHISDPDARSAGSAHADASLWDNGSDAVDELVRKQQVRSVALGNFGSANLRDGRNWSDLEEIFVPVYYSSRYQIEAAAKWLGGLRYDYAVKGSNLEPPLLETVSADGQRRALTALIETLSTRSLLVPAEVQALMLPKAAGSYRTRESVNGQTGVSFDQLHLAAGLAQHSLSLILQPERLARIAQQHANNSDIPSLADIANELHTQVVQRSEEQGMAAAVHQTVVDLLLSNYLNLLSSNALSPQLRAQILAIVKTEQTYLAKMAKRTPPSSAYYGFYHYQLERLDARSVGSESKLIELPSLPPGSPI